MRISTPKKIMFYVILIFILLLILIPIIWLIFLTFKNPQEFYLEPLSWPEKFTLENYVRAIDTAHVFTSFKNSMILTFSEIALVMVLTIPASFALARFKFKGNALIFTMFSLGVIVPPFTAIYPSFLIIKQLGLVNTHLGVILANSSFLISTSLILMVGHFKTFPHELEEAALIDGAGVWRILFKIFIPVCVPILATAATFQFLGSWNEYVFSYILLNKSALKPLTVMLSSFIGEYGTDYPGMAAAVTLAILPILIAYCAFQKYVVEGMTAGAVKG